MKGNDEGRRTIAYRKCKSGNRGQKPWNLMVNPNLNHQQLTEWVQLWFHLSPALCNNISDGSCFIFYLLLLFWCDLWGSMKMKTNSEEWRMNGCESANCKWEGRHEEACFGRHSGRIELSESNCRQADRSECRYHFTSSVCLSEPNIHTSSRQLSPDKCLPSPLSLSLLVFSSHRKWTSSVLLQAAVTKWTIPLFLACLLTFQFVPSNLTHFTYSWPF